ncbi:hypothetical protein OWR29_25665 [Actinoplanes sp. Pm04-4]|uniref:Uncharacterized protein n=1 Tax=Paractinoplanes pyxinae TaxID=2997416 RepID=A0ABT4B4I0_9ACTN|nr:hypothetical protein [Actinoplanes pyxinae]MCY1141401.1 hypothetical protein [Actinoplanes pyxinae]
MPEFLTPLQTLLVFVGPLLVLGALLAVAVPQAPELIRPRLPRRPQPTAWAYAQPVRRPAPRRADRRHGGWAVA